MTPKTLKPEVMKRAAEIAYPEYEWFISGYGVRRKVQRPGRKGIVRNVYFKLFSKNDDWVALREGLDKMGYSIVWSARVWEPHINKWGVDMISPDCYVPGSGEKIMKIIESCPRIAAYKIVEVICDE